MRAERWLPGLVVTVLGLATQVGHAKPSGRTVELQGARVVAIESTSGRVRVRPSSNETIAIQNDRRLEIRRQGPRIILASGSERLEVELPSTVLEIRSQSGRVEVEGRHRRVDIHTASGRIEVDVEAQEIELHSLAGSIEVEGRAERLRAETVSGDINCRLQGLKAARIAVTSGDVDLRARKLPSQIEVETVSGDTEIEGDLVPGADVRARSMSGRITLDRRGRQGFRLKARARFGSIRLGGQRVDVRELLTEVDGGGADVRFSTFSGRIEVR